MAGTAVSIIRRLMEAAPLRLLRARAVKHVLCPDAAEARPAGAHIAITTSVNTVAAKTMA